MRRRSPLLVAGLLILAGCKIASSEPKATSSLAPPTTFVELDQPALWPLADEVFETPDEAARSFVGSVFKVPPVFGEYRAGDSRSGEIDVLIGELPAVVRSTLLLRQLGPEDGWFVIGAVNPHMTIARPEARAVVPAGKLTVSGTARGFEAQVSITAYMAGDSRQIVSQRYALAGSAEASEPYSVELDLASAPIGSTVMIVVKGGVGLETDPGEFSAIPVVIG
jgi:hypothetical protein